jgi:hypothetical protein
MSILSYFQNYPPVFEKNITVCTNVYFTYSTYQKRLSEKNCVPKHHHLPILLILFLRPSSSGASTRTTSDCLIRRTRHTATRQMCTAAPLKEEGHGHAPREVQPRDALSHPRGVQVEVDHHGDREVVVVVVTAVVATAGRCGCRRRFHRPSDEPLHFFAARGPMRNVRRSPVRNSPRSLVAATSRPPPSLPPPMTNTSAASTPRGTFRRAAVYAAIFSSTISQPTNPPILLIARLIFSHGRTNF